MGIDMGRVEAVGKMLIYIELHHGESVSARRITESAIGCSVRNCNYLYIHLYMLSTPNSVVPSAGMTSWLFVALTFYI